MMQIKSLQACEICDEPVEQRCQKTKACGMAEIRKSNRFFLM